MESKILLNISTFDWFIAHWAKLLSWEETARQFRISWSTVWRCVDKAVEWGRAHMNLDGISAIGVDEVSQKKGHNYLTLVYQIGGSYRRLLYVAESRKEESFKGFFDWLGKERCSLIEVVCSDMWKAYLNVIKERLPKAIHILDRFHIMAHFGKAINEIRAAEAKASKRNGETLKKTKWLFLKRPENLTDGQGCRLRDLLRLNLRTVRAYLLREEFQFFWEYTSSGWARRFLKTWTTKAMRSRLEPMKRVAQMLRTHEEEILNWFKIKFDVALGATEGFNGKVRVFTKRAFGYRTVPAMKTALYHGLGELPTPTFTHRFW
jgi:transposase